MTTAQTIKVPETMDAIDSRIAQLRGELQNVKGRTTEVYTRIVGYYRPVRNWNKGKSQEYTERVVFNGPASGSETLKAEKQAQPQAPAQEAETHPGDLGLMAGPSEAVKYSFFFRNTCPNCPPVKEYVEALEMDGRFVNVDDDEQGLSEAAAYQVYSAPTVIFFNQDDVEIFRAHHTGALEEFFSGTQAAANA